MTLRLTTLGNIDLRDPRGQPLREVLTQPKRVALLVYLAVEGRRGPVSRDRILGLFWPESEESEARNTLSQALHHLRQALGADVIESQGSNAVGIRADGLWCDANAFADALDRGRLGQTLELYQGDFCQSLFGSGMPELEQWLDAQRFRSGTGTGGRWRYRRDDRRARSGCDKLAGTRRRWGGTTHSRGPTMRRMERADFHEARQLTMAGKLGRD